jgi:tRNA A-37 threonylcarbamoyl transferase component Bud32
LIGTSLDKYEVLQKVGEGGMATVYRGRHRTLRREVAIKVLHPHLSSSTRNRKRFAREARAIEVLRHDNILEIFDYSGTDAEECYIITEFVEGETLTDLVDRTGALPSEAATIVGLHLCEALAYAHKMGILHRDLKPDNVMVRLDGTVKLMDFGIARFLDESNVTMTGALVGSPAFMSPEQISEGELDHRSDLFSLGTLLFFLVTGQLPFTGSNAHLILKKIAEGTRPTVAELVPSVSATLADVIERLMATRPDDRYPTAEAVLDDLRAALTEVDVDLDDVQWGVRAWMADSEAYRRRLDDHLTAVLVQSGKALMASDDHLAALRLFNRALSMDDDNAEVLAIVQGMHQDERPRRRRYAPFAMLALGLAFTAAIIISLVRRDPPPQDPLPPVVAAEAGPAELPSAPPPAAEPAAVASPAPPTPSASAPVQPSSRPPQRAAQLATQPAAARAELAPAPSLAPKLATLEIRSNYPADIYIDDQKRGETRQPAPIEVPPGEHQIVLRGEFLQDYAMLVELAPGEHWTPGEVLRLLPRPATVELDVAFPGECAIALDARDLGTIAEVGRLVRVDHPEHPHTVTLTCPDRTVERSFDDLIAVRRATLTAE